MSYYDTAQVCLNGHMINSTVKSNPEFCKDFCDQCGARTITQCQKCSTDIQGKYQGGYGVLEPEPPPYCHICGSPFPWTDESLKAAKELIDLSNIDENEKQAIKDDLPSLLSDTPRTTIAATKMSIFLRKAGKEIGPAMRDILVNVASETAKKLLFPS